jgi:maltose alpha-D-glucosyltransferase/alpha-amylase
MRSNLGIRRRLAPLVDNDRSQLELLNALLFSLPGSPIIYYGDEIGMGDNIWLRDRNGVRTPMQWSADENAGFSTAHPGVLFAPVIDDSEYSYRTVNVANQEKNPTSLLNWTRRMIQTRKKVRGFGRGTFTILDVDNPHILVFERKYENEHIVCAFNFSRALQSVRIPIGVPGPTTVRDLIGGSTLHDARARLKYQITLGPRGYAWLLVG